MVVGGREAELGEDVVGGLADRLVRDPEAGRYRQVGQALRHQAEHLALPRRQLGDRALPPRARKQLRDDLRIDRGPARADSLHGLDELADVGDAILEHVAVAVEVAGQQVARVVLLLVL